jgi:hypothetical protein
MSTLSDTQMIVNVAGCLRPHARGNTHTDAQPNRTEPRPHSPRPSRPLHSLDVAGCPRHYNVVSAWWAGVPTQGQNACRYGELSVLTAEALPRVACREHGRGAEGAALAEGFSRTRRCGRRSPQGALSAKVQRLCPTHEITVSPMATTDFVE